MILRISSALALLACSSVSISSLLAVPVAVNDSFTTAEDTAYAGASTLVFQGDFEPLTATNVAAGPWRFLDKIQNELGTPASQSYPLDGAGRNWKALNFDEATSAIGPWGTNALPINYGALDGVPATATTNVLSPNVINLTTGNPVTTVLLRKVFTAAAADAARTDWSLNYLVDDGMIVYLNGTEIARVNMPVDPITTNSISTANGNETTYTNLPVTLPTSLMVTGQNVLAVEMHQTSLTSGDIGLDMTFTPTGGSVDDGFVGVEKAFGTNGLARGGGGGSGNGGDVEVTAFSTTAGFNGGGGVTVDVGYQPAVTPPLSPTTRSASAAWDKAFTLAAASTLRLSFRHRIVLNGNMSATEWGETTMQIDGIKYGTPAPTGPNTYPAGWKYVSRTIGAGSANGGIVDSGWQTYTIDIPLAVGAHTLRLGAFSNITNANAKHVQGFFDDIVGSIVGAGGSLLSNDTGGATQAVLVAGPSNGVLNLNTDGTFNYTPATNFNGTDSFTYKASDGTTQSANTATVSITVTPVNDPPVAVANPSYSTLEDTPLTINAASGVLANDTDVDGDTLTAVMVTTVSAASGSLTLNSNGSFTYTPAANFSGTASFTYHARDAALDSNVVTATITVTPVNDPPVAVADTYNVPKNGALTITDLNGTSITENLILGTERDGAGQAIVVKGSIWKYFATAAAPVDTVAVPWTSLAFDDSLWSEGESELGYGDGPTRPEATLIPDDAVPGYGTSTNRYTTSYFRKTVNILNLADITGIKLEVLRDDGAVFYINGTPAYRNNITPNPIYSTFATNTAASNENIFFDAAVLGTTGETNNWINVAPTKALLVEGGNIFAAEVHQSDLISSDVSFDCKFSVTRFTNAGLLKNDTDPEGSALTAILVAGPSHGSLTLNSDGSFTYTPTVGYAGPDSFTYRANDGGVNSNIATVTLNVVNAGNVKPIAVNDAYNTAVEDTTLTIPAATGVVVNDTDADGDAISAILVNDVAHGTLTLNSDGSFVYTPAANYNGTDTFTYKAKDTSNNFSTTNATVTITIAPVNDAPVAVNDSYAGNPGQTLTVAAAGVLANDTDIDTLAAGLTAQVVTNPATGSLTLNATGGFSFTPVGTGTFTFTYRTYDGQFYSAPATVTIVVNGIPVAGADTYNNAVEDTPYNVAAPGLLVNDSDPENSPLTATKVTNPTHGSVTVNANGSFQYLPNANYFGVDSFTYKVNDGSRDSAPAQVTITIGNVNDAPVGSPDLYATGPNQTLTVAAAQGVIANDSDPDGTIPTATVATNTAHGTLTLNANGSFTYIPTTGYLGTDSFTYTLTDGVLTSAAITVTITVSESGDNIVINEIMYRPGTTFPENPLQEYIELHNRGTSTVDLSNWKITSGVDFTFPPSTTMAPGSYLVVASNLAAFQAAHPGATNVLAGWIGSLSNGGEKIGLTNALAIEQDTVTYASEGDWAQRIRETTFNGWDWSPLTTTGGRSIELRNPKVSNDNGQNWQPSAVVGGTPGAANGALTANIPPIIKAVKHFPAVPTNNDTVLISCELNDESPYTTLTATLFWRNATTTTPPAFSSIPMSSDGKGGWFVPVPAQANQTIIEFYISATDGVATRTWPAPTAEGQNANCQYQVDNEPSSTTADMYRMILTASENAAFNGVATSSDRQFNQTLIFTRGAETSIRYRCGMRIRGNSSRSYQFKPLRISLPNDDTLDGYSGFNFNPKASFLQFVGMRLFQAAGLRASDAIPIELRRNGVESTTSTGSTPDYGLWVRMEDIGGDLVNNRWPLAKGGGAYKKGRSDYYWRATQAAPANPDLLLDGWTKQNNSAANDWSDVRTFFSTYMAACAAHFPTAANPLDVAASGGASTTGIGTWAGTAFTNAEITSIETVADLDQWARWMAVMTILQDNETNASNGQDDDYSAYFVPVDIGGGVIQKKMNFIPHDLDTIFGLGDSPLAYNDHGLYDMTDDTYVFRPLLPLFGNNTTGGNVAFRAKYHDALKQLLGSVFDADDTTNPNPPFNAFVDNELGTWLTPAVRTTIKTFVKNRRTYLLGLLGSGATAPAAGTSIATVTSVRGTLSINEVLANNVSAHLNGTTYPDVIELRNNGTTTLNLGGMTLTDDPLLKTKYTIPVNTQIPAGGFLVLYADAVLTAPGLHTSFGLDADGDSVYLYDTLANGQTLLDSITFGLQAPNLSIGRTGAGLDVWALCTPTIGATNTIVPTLANPNSLRINEWLGNADFLVSKDFVELYNPGATPVALGGMAISDDAINYPTQGTLPALSFMAAGGFVAFDAMGAAATPGNARELPGSINSTAGSITLLGANGVQVDRVDTISHFRDGSIGRLPDGSALQSRLAVPSPGATNATLTANELNLINYLRITELMYNPQGSTRSEYIEFRNMSDKADVPVSLDLGGVTFTDGIAYTFPVMSLAPGAHFLLVGESAKFLAQFPTATVGGVFTSGKLDNGSERVRFTIPSGTVAILDFKYEDNWYPTTDGAGESLQIVDGSGAVALWDKKIGWLAAPPSPGTAPSFGVGAGADLTIPMGTPLYLDGSIRYGAALPQDITVGWTKESGPGTVTFTTANYQDANATFSAAGTYVLKFTGTATTPAASAFDTTTITVTETYETWATRNLTGGNASSALRNNDPDQDGYTNLMEYAMGLNPAVPDVPVIYEYANGILTMRYTRSKLADPAIVILPQFSTDLSVWADETTGPEVTKTIESQTSTLETWRAVTSILTDRLFGRVTVIEP